MVQSCFSICFVFRHRLSLVLLGHLKDPWSLDLLTEKSGQLTSRTTRLDLGFIDYNAQFFRLGKVRLGCLGVVESQFGTSIFMKLVQTKFFVSGQHIVCHWLLRRLTGRQSGDTLKTFFLVEKWKCISFNVKFSTILII